MNTTTRTRVLLAVLALVVSTAILVPTTGRAHHLSYAPPAMPLSYQGGGGGP